MKISRKTDYGVRALIDLSQHYGQGEILSSDIAVRQDIPQPYLDQLLISLRKAGLVRSRRGPQGGHTLAKPPAQITLAEATAALEGSISPLSCVEEPHSCSHSPSCALRDVWQEIGEVTEKLLQATNIGALAQRQEHRQQKGAYYI